MFNLRFLFIPIAACSLLCADEVPTPAVELGPGHR